MTKVANIFIAGFIVIVSAIITIIVSIIGIERNENEKDN